MNTIKKFSIIFAMIMSMGIITQVTVASTLPPFPHQYNFDVNVVSAGPVSWISYDDVAVNWSEYTTSGVITKMQNIFSDQDIVEGAVNQIEFWNNTSGCNVFYTWQHVISAIPYKGAHCATDGRQVFMDYQQ